MFRGQRIPAAFAAALALVSAGAADAATPCPGNPNALGTSRIIEVNPLHTPLIGSHDYGRTLPLARGEVVLTFDDGPKAPNTHHVLQALADQCVQATFFMVGREAARDPATVRQIYAAGHTIGTHTHHHPLRRMSPQEAAYEINTGFAAVRAAAGDPRMVAPFFRFPGLFTTSHGEHYVRSRGIAAFSIDIDTHDWKRIGPQRMLHDTLERLDRRGGGIILMHDVQDKTAMMLPVFLSELRARGYRVVHMVPAGQRDPENGPMARSAWWPFLPQPAAESDAYAQGQPPRPAAPIPPPRLHWQHNNPFEQR
jgi:peptidoglycan/xylan/chitin deacetylase (PgdA/CDA1 family)